MLHHLRPIAAAVSALALLAGPALAQEPPRWSFAIHGGAGVIERDSLSPDQDAADRASLTRALEAGSAILADGGSGLDAVQAAIELMEDDPLFNAGRGAVFTAAGRNELDAAIMNGADRTAGAVAGLTTTRHPIAAARAVMERSPHVMLIGEGADRFAASVELEQVPPSFFFTERRWQGLESALRRQNLPVPARPEGAPAAGLDTSAMLAPPLNEKKFGTVGAVALDQAGNLVAGTSTGGMTAKQWGRVGDVPVIGAGTYASNEDGCAVSATGDGEYFIRATVARDICAGIAARARGLVPPGQPACSDAGPDAICLAHPRNPDYLAVREQLDEVARLGGSGGVIVMTRSGDAWLQMNTSGMYRGSVSSTEPAEVAIYADERPR